MQSVTAPAPRPARRKLLAGVVAVTVLAAVSYVLVSSPKDEPNLQTYVLTILIEPNRDGRFLVRVPLVETSNETPIPIEENLQVLDSLEDATGRIVFTPYGAAFEINASRAVSVEIQFQKQLRVDWRYGYYKLSMCQTDCTRPGTAFTYAGYLDATMVEEVSVTANLTYMKSTSRVYVKGFYLCRGVLSNGWGSLSGLHRMMIS